MSFENLISQYSDAPAYVHNIERVRCGTWLYRFLIFATLLLSLLVHINNGVLKAQTKIKAT